MKRATILILSLCLVVLLQVRAQTGNKMVLAKATEAKADVSIQWENVDGVHILRSWQLEGASSWPQTAIMRMSNDQYLRFSQDPNGFMAFVNEQKVFSKDVIEAGPWVTLSSVHQQGAPTGWLLTLYHGKMSTMIVSALPQLQLEYAAPKTK